MDKMEAIVRTDIEPGVIDLKLLKEAIKEQGPTGEAGRLIEEEGYSFKDITTICLEFLSMYSNCYIDFNTLFRYRLLKG